MYREESEFKILENLKHSLQLIEERISEYVSQTEIPLQLLKDRDQIIQKITEFEQVMSYFSVSVLYNRIDGILFDLDSIARNLSLQGWSEHLVNVIDDSYIALELSFQNFYSALAKEMNEQSENVVKRKRALLHLLRRTEKDITKYKNLIDFPVLEPSGSAIIHTVIEPPPNFSDRADLLQNLNESVSDNNLIIIAGVGGVGKTYLAKKFVSNLTDYHLIWFECTQDSSVEQFFYSIESVLKNSINLTDYSNFLRDKNELSKVKISKLFKFLDKYKICLVIDDFHKAKNDFDKLIEFANLNFKVSKCIVLTRRRTSAIKRIYYSSIEYEVTGIEISFVKEFLLKYRLSITDELVKPIFEKTLGHPLALRLFASFCVVERYSPEELLEEFSELWGTAFEEKLLSKMCDELEENEQEFLSKFSVFRLPVKRDAIGFIYPRDNVQTILNSLLHRFIITEPYETEFSIHELIRNYYYGVLENKEKVHLVAANYYIKNGMDSADYQNNLEAYYHFYKAGMYEEAFRSVSDILAKLETSGMFATLDKIVNELEMGLDQIPEVLIITRAKIYEIWGRWDESVEMLESYLENTLFGNQELLLSAINTLLLIYDQTGQYYKGISLYEKFKEKINWEVPSPELAHLFHRVGRFYHEWNDYEKTIKYYNQSLAISRVLDDKQNIIRTNRLIGVVYWFFGDYQQSLDQLEKTLILCEEYNNQRELADCLKHIGIVWTKIGEYEKALEYMKKSQRVSDSLAYKQGQGWIAMQLADAYIPLKRFEDTEITLTKALNIFKELGEKNGIINTEFRFGKFYCEKDEFQKSLDKFNEALLHAEELESPIWIAMVWEGFADLYKRSGDSSNELNALEKSLRIYESINSAMAIPIKERINEKK